MINIVNITCVLIHVVYLGPSKKEQQKSGHFNNDKKNPGEKVQMKRVWLIVNQVNSFDYYSSNVCTYMDNQII